MRIGRRGGQRIASEWSSHGGSTKLHSDDVAFNRLHFSIDQPLAMRIYLLVILALTVISVSAAPPAGAIPATPAPPPPPLLKPCTVAGVRIPAPTADTSLTYLSGARYEPGSYYALCNNGVPACYMDDGIADRRRPEVPCADPKLVAAVTAARAGKNGKARQLGVFIKDTNKWPEGVISYNFDPMIVTQPVFREATKEYTDLGLRFIDINDCAKLYKPNGQKTNVCSDCRYHVASFLTIQVVMGVSGSTQARGWNSMWATVVMSSIPISTSFGHIVGLNHEHQHPNQRVIIIKSEMKVNASEYVKFKDGERTTTAYDINSIMHYDGSEFCIPWFTPRGGFCDADKAGNWHGWSGCMEPAKAHCSPVDRTVIGRAAHLTDHDKANVRQLYNLRA